MNKNIIHITILLIGLGLSIRLNANSADCLNRLAKKLPNLSMEHAIKLCKGANSTAPAKCLEKLAKNLPNLSMEHAITLCTGANSTAPANCIKKLAKNSPNLSMEHAITLCTGAKLKWWEIWQ